MKLEKEIKVRRFPENPILRPDPSRPWMSLNVFNAGVIRDSTGLFKMLFRATGTPDQSESDLGFAWSKDGVRWQVLAEPVLKHGFNSYCTLGIEDPRIVPWLHGWNYIFATAYSSAGARVGIWRTKDFSNFEWVGIFSDQEDKDASIFPELINEWVNEWVYLLHRKPSGDIWISRTKTLSLSGGWQDDHILVGKEDFYVSPKTGRSPKKIGIAGPPIKTPKGWLVIVHVVHGSEEDISNRTYSLGFMVLNLKSLEVEYIHPKSILWPKETYETEGSVPNVCFSTAVVDPGKDAPNLLVYYGGADTYVAVGELPKDKLKMCY